MSELSSGLQDVIAERTRQCTEENWSADHDDAHAAGTLLRAGVGYAVNAAFSIECMSHDTSESSAPYNWPWSQYWWKPTTVRRDLVKAAALIIAEIDRIDREANK